METKKTDKNKLVRRIVLIVLGIALVCYLAPRIIRRVNILRNMHSVYSDAIFVGLSCDNTATSLDTLNQFHWTDTDGAPDEKIYIFTITDSEDNVGVGFATFWGDVIADSYCSDYYYDRKIEEFLDIVKFPQNFPGLKYYIWDINMDDKYRMIRTADCTTYEGYKNGYIVSELTSFFDGCYPVLWVGVGTDSTETIFEINTYLRKAGFDIYVDYKEIFDNFDPETLDGLGDDDLAVYYPYGLNYKIVKMGQSISETVKEKSSEFLIVDISENGKPVERYQAFYSGRIVKKVFGSDGQMSESESFLSDEDYLALICFTEAAEDDTKGFVYTSITGEGDRVYYFTSRDVRRDRLWDDELFFMDYEDYRTGPAMDIMRSYF